MVHNGILCLILLIGWEKKRKDNNIVVILGYLSENIFSNIIFIPESFNFKNISHKLFDYKITFLNSQNQNTNEKGDFVPVLFKDLWYTKMI